MNSHEIREATEKEPFIHTSSDKKNEIMFEDAPEMTNRRTGHDAFTSEVPANVGEDCWEETVLIRLFVYGVRHHLPINSVYVCGVNFQLMSKLFSSDVIWKGYLRDFRCYYGCQSGWTEHAGVCSGSGSAHS